MILENIFNSQTNLKKGILLVKKWFDPSDQFQPKNNNFGCVMKLVFSVEIGQNHPNWTKFAEKQKKFGPDEEPRRKKRINIPFSPVGIPT